jgi:hypothetical protein
MDVSDSDHSASPRSPCSHHSEDSTSGVTDSQPKSRGRKEAAHWRLEEETAFLQFLYDNKSGTDGATFPRKTYSAASAHLIEKFKNQKGGIKTYSACTTKFSTLKKAYDAARALKTGGSSSGFTWTDEGGATIDKDTASAWAGYVRVSTALPISALDPNIFLSPIRTPNNSRAKDSNISTSLTC